FSRTVVCRCLYTAISRVLCDMLHAVCNRGMASARQHIALNCTKAGAQAIVEHLVADTDDQAADQRWIDVETHLKAITVACAQFLSDPRLLCVVECDRAADLARERMRLTTAVALEGMDDVG